VNKLNEDSREAPYARYLSRLVRPFPDFDFFFIKPVRQRAVALLGLKEGDRVLDLGCGPGGSFPYLVDAVGRSGLVCGVDISPQSCINARRRIARNKWKNVDVTEAAAQDAQLVGPYDGALMFAAPDVFASEAALTNIFPHLREGARVVCFGAKLSESLAGKILNPTLRKAVATLSPTTPIPDREPWAMLEKRIDGLEIEEYFFGSMFLAAGSVRARKRTSG
jgi:demethylmenaquinone methyltransferase/2-methoxy-6-polyprenyl-1,4-benzoquinol methylase